MKDRFSYLFPPIIIAASVCVDTLAVAMVGYGGATAADELQELDFGFWALQLTNTAFAVWAFLYSSGKSYLWAVYPLLTSD